VKSLQTEEIVLHGALQANWHLGKTNVDRSQECAICSAGCLQSWNSLDSATALCSSHSMQT